MSKTEDLLGMVADSHSIPIWDDGLAMMVDSVNSRPAKRILSMEDLEMVAGGVGGTSNLPSDKEIAERLKKNVLGIN